MVVHSTVGSIWGLDCDFPLYVSSCWMYRVPVQLPLVDVEIHQSDFGPPVIVQGYVGMVYFHSLELLAFPFA